MISTKQKFVTSNGTEFNTEEEAQAYEITRAHETREYNHRARYAKILPISHPKDSETHEHCILTGRLCNTYDTYDHPHCGSTERDTLTKKIIIPSYNVDGRCISSVVINDFLDGLQNLIESYNKLYNDHNES